METNTILLAVIAISFIVIAVNTFIIAKNAAACKLKEEGYICLLNQNYDQAFEKFDKLSLCKGVKDNQGEYLKAYTLYARNKGEDRTEADNLLKTVIRENLSGKTEADKWFKNILKK